ncbi:hypothetical protein TELCIR_04498 [Teladorsagia circumcincta]|uniref:Secreted protein n=1 Tax=Teladorsagia circumcincta TaxID=45464 RepID=A0A2G9UTP9_TELCI|nr:hypothetical protein TELCIR_04498 [Teladorsagia circumcincta]
MVFLRVLCFIVLLQMVEACLIPRCCCPVPCPVPCPMPCPMPVGLPIPVPVRPCPPPTKPCCCFLTSPSMALATTTAPIGVPDVVVGSCGSFFRVDSKSANRMIFLSLF